MLVLGEGITNKLHDNFTKIEESKMNDFLKIQDKVQLAFFIASHHRRSQVMFRILDALSTKKTATLSFDIKYINSALGYTDCEFKAWLDMILMDSTITIINYFNHVDTWLVTFHRDLKNERK